ncbi:MAG: LON peptidase substrate-binding domain-containing protein [Hylemonella sp.]|uniref:LON peptidase substrate-binding domain-containing protein n=1 Tax=Hylemonella sp. TaxID=2066020 RepID=UPI00391B7AC6
MPDTFQLPLFPLQTVLFPGGVLPLRIFEVRYLDLIQRCQKEGAPFGVVCLTQGSEVRQAPAAGEAAPAEVFHPIGTLAHIEMYERPQPGLMLIRCRGGRRFRLLRSEQMKHGLWTGEAEYLDEDPVVPVPQDLVPVRVGLQRLLQHMQAQAQPGDELPIQGPLQWDHCGWVAHRWCDILPVSPQLKQQFLAVDNPLIRLELVGDLLARLKIGTAPE